MNIARSLILLIAAQVAILAAVPSVRADIVLFGLDSSTEGELPNRVDPSKPSLLFKFEDTALDQVTVTFDATNLQPNNFISGVLFNLGTTFGLVFVDLPDGFNFFGTFPRYGMAWDFPPSMPACSTSRSVSIPTRIRGTCSTGARRGRRSSAAPACGPPTSS